MSDDEDLRRAFAKEMDEDADDESCEEGGKSLLLSCVLYPQFQAICTDLILSHAPY